jgi:hypothetical protein
MASRVQQLRNFVTGQRPQQGEAEVGVIYANTADKQFGVFDTSREPQDLVAIRYYSEEAVYSIGDYVVHNGQLYHCIRASSYMGPFDPDLWNKVDAKGDKGDPGQKGDQGIQGLQGVMGIPGPQGPPGEVGTPVGEFHFRLPSELPPNGLLPAHWDGPNRPPTSYQMKIGQALICRNDGHLWVFLNVIHLSPMPALPGQMLGPQGWVDAGRIQGPIGPQGVPGPQGIQGIQGLKGDRGAPGRVATPVGDFAKRSQSELPIDGFIPKDWDKPGKPEVDIQMNLGDALVHLPTAQLWVYVTDVEDPTGWMNVGNVVGPEGAQGPQGVPGIQGIQGLTGQKGDKGDAGIVSRVIGYFNVNPLTLPQNGFVPAAWDRNSSPSVDYQMLIGEGLLHQPTGRLYIFVGDDPVGFTDLPHGWVDVGVIMGPPGPVGERGPQGIQGNQGVKGDRGPAGRLGTPVGDFSNRTPSQLPPNGDIPANWDAPGKPPKDLQLHPGEGFIHVPTKDMWIYVSTLEDPTGWVNIGNIVGPQGDPGPQGLQGPPGRDGVSITGPAGPQGSPGIQGIQGLTGAVGPQGATGTSAADTIIVSTSTPNATQGGEKWIWFQI